MLPPDGLSGSDLLYDADCGYIVRGLESLWDWAAGMRMGLVIRAGLWGGKVDWLVHGGFGMESRGRRGWRFSL